MWLSSETTHTVLGILSTLDRKMKNKYTNTLRMIPDDSSNSLLFVQLGTQYLKYLNITGCVLKKKNTKVTQFTATLKVANESS